MRGRAAAANKAPKKVHAVEWESSDCACYDCGGKVASGHDACSDEADDRRAKDSFLTAACPPAVVALWCPRSRYLHSIMFLTQQVRSGRMEVEDALLYCCTL